jgi:hypothetical protein
MCLTGCWGLFWEGFRPSQQQWLSKNACGHTWARMCVCLACCRCPATNARMGHCAMGTFANPAGCGRTARQRCGGARCLAHLRPAREKLLGWMNGVLQAPSGDSCRASTLVELVLASAKINKDVQCFHSILLWSSLCLLPREWLQHTCLSCGGCESDP